MKKQLFFIILLGVVELLAGCRPEGKEPETGVSIGLARQRKQDISNLQYRLKFRIPENKQEEVIGKVQITLKQEKVQPVVLDFREDPHKVKQLKVNGRPDSIRISNEHIVVGTDYLKKGANEIEIDFIAGNQSLNRNDEFLYTLLVPERARTLFPCFDQPDMKAVFTLQLDIPEQWVAVANAAVESETLHEGRKLIAFQPTQPLSTYLFSFVAGKWQQLAESRDGKTIVMYYRETDPQKVAQHTIIFDQVFASLKWLEDYTGIPYPFDKYDLVIVPGFQFGGMEHPGAVLYNDKRMFLGPHPTIEEELGRMELIAHETTHMWFGDAVTMAWFDDVWTKEVFANYFASQMTRPEFPGVNHLLNDLRNFYIPAYAEDRTAGSTSIKQPLENLKDAGLIYGQIVYDKAPIVMNMLLKLLGEEAFQKGIREYLQTYLYGNATWDNLITILNKYTDKDLVAWSNSWVNEKGMPEISVSWHDRTLVVRQKDPWHRGLSWPQNISVALYEGKNADTLQSSVHEVTLVSDSAVTVFQNRSADESCIFLNQNGEAYGYFVLDQRTITYALAHLNTFAKAPETRLALLINLNENRLHGRVDGLAFARMLISNLKTETEPLIISTSIAYLNEMALHGQIAGSEELEESLLGLARKPGGKGCQQAAFRALLGTFWQPATTQEIYRMWKEQKSFTGLALGESDYTKMAYELTVRMPEKYEEIRATQATRIQDPDRKREFNFIVRAVAPETETRDSLFRSLLIAGNRRIEPWVTQIVGYLNHPLRQQQAVKYIRPALQELQEVQRTGDIFFPKNWISATLRGHNSPEAAQVVRQFLEQHPDYPVLLKNKILQSADHLYR